MKVTGKLAMIGLVSAGCLTAPATVSANPLDPLLELFRSWFESGEDGDGNNQGPPALNPLPGEGGDLFSSVPQLQVATGSRSVSVEEGQSARIRITLSKATDNPVVVGVEVTEREGTSPALFSGGGGVVTFPAGSTSQEVVVDTVDDKNFDASVRGFRVSLVRPDTTQAMNAQIDLASADAVVTIVENDAPPPPPPPPARLVASQARVGFGEILVGRSAQREVVVTNAGERPITPGPAQFRRPGPFSVVFDECAARPLRPGRACSVTVAFGPDTPGSHEARLTIGGPGSKAETALVGFARKPVVVEDPQAARIAALKAQRRSSDGTVKSFEVPPAAPSEKVKYTTDDPDWAAIGIGRTYFSLKVDRERIITVDRVIPCVLEDTIHSELPGPVVCQVESHVFGADGRFVLIPAGSRVVGSYETMAAAGDTRLNVVWNRFFRPDGSSVAIGDGFQGADAAGSTGIPGHIDKRIVERFSTPVLLTLLTAGATAIVPADDDQYAAAAENLTEGIGEVATQLLEENLDIRPTMKVPAGTRLTIRPLVDLWFPRADRLVPTPDENVDNAGG